MKHDLCSIMGLLLLGVCGYVWLKDEYVLWSSSFSLSTLYILRFASSHSHILLYCLLLSRVVCTSAAFPSFISQRHTGFCSHSFCEILMSHYLFILPLFPSVVSLSPVFKSLCCSHLSSHLSFLTYCKINWEHQVAVKSFHLLNVLVVRCFLLGFIFVCLFV